jgi:hypothetical protein
MLAVVHAREFDGDAVDEMSRAADELIDKLPLRQPIECTLRDSIGGRIGRFFLGTSEPDEFDCDAQQAKLRSQRGASLHLVDRDGQVAEVLMVVDSVSV